MSHRENNVGLTKYRATDGQVRHAVQADQLAPKRMTGTPNACRRNQIWRIDSSCGVPILGVSKCYTYWRMAHLTVMLRTIPSLRLYLVGGYSSQILRYFIEPPSLSHRHVFIYLQVFDSRPGRVLNVRSQRLNFGRHVESISMLKISCPQKS